MNTNWINKLIGDYTPYRFKLIDYLTAGIMGFISLAVYTVTLTPSVSAGDNGELTSAIFFLGLGHAPGYPIHSLFGKLFTFLPINNIGWRANFYSAVSTGFSITLAYLVFLKLVSSLSKNHWYAIIAAMVGALSFAFSEALWGQSVTTEVYAVSAIFYPLLSLVILKWFDQVYSRQGSTHPYFGENYLLAFAFILGIGLGGHQTLAITEFFFGGIVAFGLLFFQILPRKNFEQKLPSGIAHFIAVMILVVIAWYAYLSYIVSLKINLFANNYDNLKTGVWTFALCNVALLAYYLINKLQELRNPRSQDPDNSFKRLALFTIKFFGMMFLGLFVYLYLFIRSHGSPPINWGGIDQSVDWWGKIAKFFTMINRKQFAPNTINPSLGTFYYQSIAFLKDIAYEQFTLPLWGLVALGIVELYRKSRLFLIWLFVGFFAFSLQLILYINYDISIIDLFFVEVFFVFSYFIIAAFIPFGLMFLFKSIEWLLLKIAPAKSLLTEKHKRAKGARVASLIVAGLIGVIVLFGVPRAPQDLFQFQRNYTINDNQQNWANHEYGYNLMMSAEPNSIFMTEGGDNQVFSLLYFATTEHMRPDIDFFDQKGNVFPRLYGDLLNTPPDELELIRSIRDFQLFSTGRPVYLTWERPNLEKINVNYLQFLKGEMLKKYPPNIQSIINSKYRFNNLNDLKYTARNMVPNSVYDLALRSGGNLAKQDFRYMGPWYLKNFGMVYRVTPLRYAIVDALETFNGAAEYAQIATKVKELSKIAMIPNQFNFYVNQLVEEGYLERDGEAVVILKPYRASFDHLAPLDQWKHYAYSYTNAPSARYWDFLTREIFGNYTRVYNTSSERRINMLRNKLSITTDLPSQTAIQTEISELQKRQQFFNSTAITLNYDNPGMTYDQSRRLFNAGDRKGAAEAYAMTARGNYRFNENYLRATSILLDYAESNPEEQEGLLALAKGYLAEFYPSFEKFYVMTGQNGDPNQLPQMNNAKNLEQRINGIANVSVDEITALAANAGNDIAKLNQLIALYQQRGTYLKAIEVMQKVISLEPTNFEHYLKLVDYAKQNRIDLALSTVNTMIEKYSEFSEAKPSIAELQYLRGEILFNIATVQRSQNAPANQVTEAFRLSTDALNYFIAEHQGKPGLDPKISQQLNRAQAILTSIKEQTKN